MAEVLSRLVAPDPGWTTKPKLADDHVLLVALETLAEMGDERAAPYLVMPLTRGDAVDTRVAARVLERLMPRDLAGLALLEGKVRDRGWYGYDNWWPDGRPPLQTYVEAGDARAALERGLPTAAIGLLSANANGRTRELATRALAGVTDGSELPFLMLRANDWVNEVSGVARRAIKRRCLPENAPGFVAVLPFVERLKAQRRVDKTDLVHQIESMLVGSAAGLDAIEAAIRGAHDTAVRRSVARLARLSNCPLDRIECALSDPDTLVRTQYALAVTERATETELRRWLPRLFADKSPRIRSAAFRAADSKLPDVLSGELPRFLFDSNFWLREFARQKVGLDAAASAKLYAGAVAEGSARRLSAAIAGLGEVGGESDAAILLPHTMTGRSATRQVALRAVFALLKAKAVPTLVEALGSKAPGVSKVAAELLLTRGLVVFGDDVAPLTAAAAAHVRANALRALAGIDKWEALIAALERAADTDPSVVGAAQRILKRWAYAPHELYVLPKGKQRERLQAAVRVAPAGVENVVRTVNFILGSA